MEELKRCPFCGGEGCIQEHVFVGYTSTFGVVCLDCCAETRQFFNTKDEAIAAWNRRADGWIPVDKRVPDADEHMALAIVNGKPHKNITLHGAYMLAEYSEKEGWILENYPEWEGAEITHWKTLPAPPKGE